MNTRECDTTSRHSLCLLSVVFLCVAFVGDEVSRGQLAPLRVLEIMSWDMGRNGIGILRLIGTRLFQASCPN